MAEIENKFIIINVKDLKYLTGEYRERLFVILKGIEFGRQDEGKKINDYWVCNQDEPYADQVISAILNGEDKKVIPLEPPVIKKNADGLLPCPICGSEARVGGSSYEPEGVYVYCTNRNCHLAFGENYDRDGIDDHWYNNDKEVIEDWNKRI